MPKSLAYFEAKLALAREELQALQVRTGVAPDKEPQELSLTSKLKRLSRQTHERSYRQMQKHLAARGRFLRKLKSVRARVQHLTLMCDLRRTSRYTALGDL